LPISGAAAADREWDTTRMKPITAGLFAVRIPAVRAMCVDAGTALRTE